MERLESFGITVGKGKQYEEIIYSLVLLYNLLQDKAQAYLEKHDLTPSKFNMLMVIKHHGKDMGISQKDIGSKLIVSPSNMTRMLERLQKQGLITRTAPRQDKRVKLVKITAKGGKLLDECWPEHTRTLQDSTSMLSKHQQNQLSTLLRLWLNKFEE